MNIDIRSLVPAAILFSVVVSACAAEGDDADDARVDEVVDQSSSALTNTGGTGLTGDKCTSCGCTLEKTSGPDENGCRTYRCVCDSEAKAKCVTGSKVSAFRAMATSTSTGNEAVAAP